MSIVVVEPGKDCLGETYNLTHDSTTVAFTLGAKNTDVSNILEKA